MHMVELLSTVVEYVAGGLRKHACVRPLGQMEEFAETKYPSLLVTVEPRGLSLPCKANGVRHVSLVVNLRRRSLPPLVVHRHAAVVVVPRALQPSLVHARDRLLPHGRRDKRLRRGGRVDRGRYLCGAAGHLRVDGLDVLGGWDFGDTWGRHT